MRLPSRYFLTVVRPFDVLPLVVARPALDFWLWLLSVVVVVVVVVVVCLCFCVDDDEEEEEEEDDDIESISAHELTLRHTTNATAAAPNVLNILFFMLFV